MDRRMAWLALTALALAVLMLFGWRQWKAWHTVDLPEPVRADWQGRPAPSVFHTDGGGRPATLVEMATQTAGGFRSEVIQTRLVLLGVPVKFKAMVPLGCETRLVILGRSSTVTVTTWLVTLPLGEVMITR